MKKQKTPKGIKYEADSDGTIRMYKVWSKSHTSPEPFVITDDLEDFIAQMNKYTGMWNIKGQKEFKALLKFVTDYNNKYT